MLPSVEVHWLELTGPRAREALLGAGRCLDNNELARGQKRGGERWLIARVLLRQTLAARLGCAPQEVRIITEGLGKPAIGGSSLRFNLSHSGDRMLLALADGIEVGVDLERVDRRRDVLGLARRSFHADEAERIAHAPDPVEAFFRAWTRKEALAKCLGTGVFGGVLALEIVPGVPTVFGGRTAIVADLDAGNGWLAALASQA